MHMATPAHKAKPPPFLHRITALPLAAELRGGLYPLASRGGTDPVKRLLLLGPFSFCKRQYFFLDLRVGPGSFKAFPAWEFIFGLSKRKRK